MATPAVEYQTYNCKVHNKIIYFFKSDNYITGYFHCWDCIKAHNNGSFVYPYRQTK